MLVGTGVWVLVGRGVGVCVGVAVGVAVGGTGVEVCVGTGVGGALVGSGVGVFVGVAVGGAPASACLWVWESAVQVGMGDWGGITRTNRVVLFSSTDSTTCEAESTTTEFSPERVPVISRRTESPTPRPLTGT